MYVYMYIYICIRIYVYIFLSQYTNFIQFGKSDGYSTRISHSTFSGSMVSTFRRESSCHDPTWHLQCLPLCRSAGSIWCASREGFQVLRQWVCAQGDDIPCPFSLRHYWSYIESMQGTASTLHFSDYQGQAHTIACSKGGQQGDAFETVRFAVTTPLVGPSVCASCCLHRGRHLRRCFHRCTTCRRSCSCCWAQTGTQARSWSRPRCAQVQLLLSGWLNQRRRSCTCSFFYNALQANPQLACLSGMDAGISTTGLRVAGVPIGNDEWVQQFVQAKAAAVQVDVGKLDIISDGLIHHRMLRFCQNTRLAFLGTPHIRHLCKSRCHDFGGALSKRYNWRLCQMDCCLSPFCWHEIAATILSGRVWCHSQCL